MFNLDVNTDFGKRVLKKLRDEQVVWLTTVHPNGTPQPNPVWFLWDDEKVLIYSQPQAKKVSHIRKNPKVALSFNTTKDGDDVVILIGEAQIDASPLPVNRNPAYLEKYTQGIYDTNSTPDRMSEEYSTVIRVMPKHVRGF